jgi:hypothetical protein
MRRSSWKWIAANCAVIIAVAASVGLAAGGDGTRSRDTAGNGNGDGGRLRAEVKAPREHLADLAKELGVSENDVRDALEAVRDKLDPPRFRRGDGPPSRAQLERRCNEFTDALASELGKSGDEVRSVIKKVLEADIEEAVRDDRLTRRQADRILARIDEAGCLPFGPHGPGGIGCADRTAPPPGVPGRGDMERPAPPPAGGIFVP